MPPNHKFTKAEIVQAALDLLRQQGMEAITARALAQRLHTTPRPIFSHFSSMQELKNAVIQAAAAVYNQYIRTALGQNGTYKSAGLAYIRLAREEKQIFRLLFMSDYLAGSSYRPVDETLSDIHGVIAKNAGITIQQAQELHKRMWMFTHGIAALLCTGAYTLSDAEIDLLLTDEFKGLMYVYKGEAK